MIETKDHLAKQNKHDDLCKILAHDLSARYGYETHLEVPFYGKNGTLRYIADVVAVTPLSDRIRVYEVKGNPRGFSRAEKQLDVADRCCRYHKGYSPHLIMVSVEDDAYVTRRHHYD